MMEIACLEVSDTGCKTADMDAVQKPIDAGIKQMSGNSMYSYGAQ